MKALLLSVCVAVAGTLVAQSTQTRTPGTFNRISVNNNIDATIVRGSDYSVELSGRAELVEAVKTEIDGNTLKLEYDRDLYESFKGLWKDNTIKAVITLPALTGVVANGGADVTSAEAWRADEFSVIANGGADIDINVQTVNAKIIANGGADVRIGGKVKSLKVTANGGADVEARDFAAEDVDITANGGADVSVHADNTLKARANGSADITYYGNASQVDVKSNGGADIERG